jgi:hypothetical protein
MREARTLASGIAQLSVFSAKTVVAAVPEVGERRRRPP